MAERFWPKVEKTGGCWPWSAAKTPDGYGKIGRGKAGEGYTKAHRVSWELAFGPIPEGLCVLHRCDNPACVNPDHLFLGTHIENMADMAAKGRSNRGERNPMARLNASQVLRIRELLVHGDRKASIAEKFGVTESAVNHIASGRKWKHVP